MISMARPIIGKKERWLIFEEKLYKDNGVDAIFVGNSLIGRVPEKRSFKVSNPLLIGLISPAAAEAYLVVIYGQSLKLLKYLKKKINAKFVMFSVSDSVVFDLPEYIELETSGDFEKI